ncbi:MAG: DNA translocase FtsK 4TM domain-containing protein [Nitrospirae bacterium]|nr:DNA translocase FtsK 4TM domain-containing protein [Nitrospirota bacterium]
MAETVKDSRSPIIGFLSALLSLFATASLATYNKWDPSPFTYTSLPPQNYGGIAGAYVADVLMSVFGTSAYIVPVILLFYAVRRFAGYARKPENILGIVLLTVSMSITFSLMSDTFDITIVKGGLIGSSISYILQTFLSTVVAFIITLSILYTSIVLLMPMSLSTVGSGSHHPSTTASDTSKPLTHTVHKDSHREESPRKKESVQKESETKQYHMDKPQTDTIAKDVKIAENKRKELPDETKNKRAATKRADIKTDKKEQPSVFRPKPQEIKKGQYTLPSVELLSSEPEEGHIVTKEELLQMASTLQDMLSDFGADGKILQVHPGPIVTMYEFEPSAGVKISKIMSLSDDIGRAMGGIKIRISLIPGKTPIGIEVPNEIKTLVTLREIIASDKFSKRSAILTVSLGMDIYGKPIVEDLTRMPNLLIAGASGSGKNMIINAMIISILYKAKPSQVKMLMIDPKLTELSGYEGIPHLISRVIKNPKEASEALKKMLLEMERRYRLIAAQGSRNIEMFNASIAEEDKLPYIVVIIEELADLMFTESKNVEDSIERLAQMARAAGIHMIVATQRPSNDIITSSIKANFPSRIACMVSSKVESRTVLDTHGAEKLLGRGDMLILSPGAKITRVHGAYVSEEEIKTVSDYVKAQGTPDYTLLDNLMPSDTIKETTPNERDEIYKEVIHYAQSIGEISITSIQRRFKLGYNRAARIMEMMEEDGLIGPPKGAGKPRDFVSN